MNCQKLVSMYSFVYSVALRRKHVTLVNKRWQKSPFSVRNGKGCSNRYERYNIIRGCTNMHTHSKLCLLKKSLYAESLFWTRLADLEDNSNRGQSAALPANQQADPMEGDKIRIANQRILWWWQILENAVIWTCSQVFTFTVFEHGSIRWKPAGCNLLHSKNPAISLSSRLLARQSTYYIYQALLQVCWRVIRAASKSVKKYLKAGQLA